MRVVVPAVGRYEGGFQLRITLIGLAPDTGTVVRNR